MSLARPKSRSFAVPSRVTMMFAGFRSRCRIPRSCAASSASSSASQAVHLLDGERAAHRFALDEFQHEVAGADVVNLTDVGVVQSGYRARFVFKADATDSSGRKPLWKNLDRYVAAETGVARPIHITHATRANGDLDLVRAELCRQEETYGPAKF